jgi:hypothetical protein
MKRLVSILLALAVCAALVAGAAATPNEITLLSSAGIPFVSKWAGAPVPGGAVEVTSRPGSWDTSLLAEGAVWIWSESPVTGGRGVSGDVIEFTDTFELECTPISAQLALDITADNEYHVHLNGTQVADSTWTEIYPDKCPRYEDHYTYRSVYHHDISEPFQSGINTLVFEVLNLPCYTDSGNPGGLIYKAVITYECGPMQVDIDIKPGSWPNSINLGSKGVIPIAILSTPDFDATQVDPGTVALAGAGVALRGKGNKSLAHEEDVNGDGLPDLVVQVETENLDPSVFQDGFATLTGQTFGGQDIQGSDEIVVVPPE